MANRYISTKQLLIVDSHLQPKFCYTNISYYQDVLLTNVFLFLHINTLHAGLNILKL